MFGAMSNWFENGIFLYTAWTFRVSDPNGSFDSNLFVVRRKTAPKISFVDFMNEKKKCNELMSFATLFSYAHSNRVL